MSSNQQKIRSVFYMIRIMRKLAFHICQNKDADQLCSIAQLIRDFVFASQILQLLFFLNLNFKLLAFFYDFAAKFVSDPVRNQEDQYSCLVANIMTYSLSAENFVQSPFLPVCDISLQVNLWTQPRNSDEKQTFFVLNMSLVIRKPEFCLCYNKGADQL